MFLVGLRGLESYFTEGWDINVNEIIKSKFLDFTKQMHVNQMILYSRCHILYRNSKDYRGQS